MPQKHTGICEEGKGAIKGDEEMRIHRDISWREIATKENYVDYLLGHCNHKSLVTQAMALQRASLELGDMADAFGDFFDDEEDITLAKFLADNREPQYDKGFAAFCKEVAEEESDPYAARGIREGDFFKEM
jgi:hypothetical protein